MLSALWNIRCVCSAVAMTLLCGSAASAQDRKLSALEIFDSALAKFEADRVELRPWQYHQTLTTHQTNGSGKVIAKGTWKSIVRPGDPSPPEYTSESLEGKLSFFQTETSKPAPMPAGQNAAPAPARATPAPEVKEENQAEATVAAVRKYHLRDRYVWTRLPNEMAAGESAYVLSFVPKAKQNTKTREERFFGQLAGRIWVSRSDFMVLKAEGALQEPCHLFWAIAQVSTFEFTYKLNPAAGAPRLLRGSKASAKTVVSFPFFAVRQKHWLEADHFEPRTPHGSAQKEPAANLPPSKKEGK